MNPLFALLLAIQTAPAPPPFVALPPADWSTLAELIYLHPLRDTSALSDFVREEVRAGRCVSNDTSVRVDLAVLVGIDGRVRRIVPRAIDCPTVEQYASGIISRLARRNVTVPTIESWYRTTVTFSWIP